MKIALASNKQDTENAISEIGRLQETIDELKAKCTLALSQIDFYKEALAAREKQLKGAYVMNTIGWCFPAVAVGVYGFMTDEIDNYDALKMAMATLAVCQLTYQGGHWIFRIW